MDTLLGLGKDLLLTPGGVKKAIIFGCKLILTLVFAHWVVGHFAGEDIMALALGLQWAHLGELGVLALLAVFTLLGSWFLMAEIVCGLPNLLSATWNLFAKDSRQTDNREVISKFLPWILKKFQVVEMDRRGRKIAPMENASKLKQFVDQIEAGEMDHIQDEVENSLGTQLQGVLVGCLLEYWLVLPSKWHSILIPFAMVLFILLVRLATYGLRVLFEDGIKMLAELKPLADYLQIREWMRLAFIQFSLYDLGEKRRRIDHSVIQDGKETWIYIERRHRVARQEAVQRFWEKEETNVHRVIMLLSVPPTPAALAFANTTDERLVLVHAENEDVVREVFYRYFG